MRALLLSPQAWRELAAIEDYTILTWGEQKARNYLHAFNVAFTMLRENPLIGHTYKGLPSPYRACRVEKHIVIYRFDAKTVEILNVLHQAMDIETRLKPRE